MLIKLWLSVDSAACSSSSTHAQQWTGCSGAADSNTLACGKRGWEVPLLTCRLMCVGDVSVLLYHKSKPENKARPNLQFFSFCSSESNHQDFTHQLTVITCAIIQSGVGESRFETSAPPANGSSSWWRSSEQHGSYLPLPSPREGQRAEWNGKTFSLLWLTALTIYPYI